MKLENTKILIQQSIESWDTITPIKLKEIDAVLDELIDDGLDYENICYFLLNIIHK